MSFSQKDMAANTSGNMVHDSQSSLEMCEAVFDFATRNLRTVEGLESGKVYCCKSFIITLVSCLTPFC